jgi:hypothetical protein
MSRFEQYMIDEGLIDLIKGAWAKLKSHIASIFARETEDLIPGETIEISIPTSTLQEDMGGSIISAKGNYNEVLLCRKVMDKDGSPGVSIDKKKYAEEIKKIDSRIISLESDIGKEPDSIELIKEVNLSADAMSKYLIGQARKSGCIIKGIWLDNLAFKRDTEKKVDIRLELEKNGKELYDAYSLKLYRGAEVNLINTTPTGLIASLFGKKAALELKARFDNNKKLVDLIAGAKSIVREMNIAKKEKKSQVFIAELRAQRAILRKDINPIIADITHEFLLEYYKKDFELFCTNLLGVLGFHDKDVKIMLAIVKKLKSGDVVSLIDKHPELDLNKIRIVHKKGTVTISIKDDFGRIILNFIQNQGEKYNIAGKVKFDTSTAVDLSQFD